jgi:inosine-uridine nucleoside N-ribohydrolase
MLAIVIDTDPGCDDALALFFALQSSKFSVKAVTTVCGNASIEAVTRNAAHILKLLGHSSVPLFSGASAPLAASLVNAVVHGEGGLGRIRVEGTTPLSGDAPERIRDILEANPGKVTVVALGPLTNLAHVAQRYPGTLEKAREVVILGGSVRPPGNKGRVAEFNFFVDPEAAQLVLASKARKTLVTLDACLPVVLQREDFLSIADPALRAAALDMMEPYIEANAAEEGIHGAIMYDPLPFYYLVNPSAATLVPHDVVVETKGEYTRGMLVADLRPIASRVMNVTVAEKIDPALFKRDFIKGINRGL